MILVFLEFVVQDSDQVKCYFIVNAEIDLKTNTFLKMAWGTSRKKKKNLPWNDPVYLCDLNIVIVCLENLFLCKI